MSEANAIKASVVIPAYNAEATLERAVASVFEQEMPEVEIIIVDDVSSDGTMALAERLTASDPRIRLLRQAINGGPAAARNAGLRAARGDTICFLDADDAYLPGFLTTCLGVLSIHPSFASVKTDVELADFDGEIDDQRYGAIVNVLPSNVLIRRPVAEIIGGFPEDQAFRGPAAGVDGVFRAVLGQCFPQGHIPRPLLRHYVGDDSHLRLFLGRSEATDNGIAFDAKSATEEEASGAIDAASQRFIDGFAARITAAAGSGLAAGSLPFHQLAPLALGEISMFQELTEGLAGTAGALTPREGYMLHMAAAFGLDGGAGKGAVVDIGPFQGLSTTWLASGLKRAKRDKAVVCDPGGWVPAAGQDGHEEAFRRTITGGDLGDWLDVRTEPAKMAASEFDGPVRLLFAGPEPACPAIPSALAAWMTLVAPGGLVALAGVGTHPLMTVLAEQIEGESVAWTPTYALDNLRFYERSGW